MHKTSYPQNFILFLRLIFINYKGLKTLRENRRITCIKQVKLKMDQMRKITLLVFGFIASALMNSCEIEQPITYFTIDGVNHDLSEGFMDDWGTNSSGVINTRRYAISFRSDEYFPGNYITFFLSSYETSGLAVGDYYYYFPAEQGEFSDIRVGSDIRYDGDGFEISGTIYDESVAEFDGVIRISIESNGNYDFFFDINMTIRDAYKGDFSQDVYNLAGEFNDDLTLNSGAVNLDWY